MAVANSRMTLGAVLGTVQTTAFAVSETMSGLSNSAGMFNAAVVNARVKQEKRHKADLATFEDLYTLEKAREIETMKAEIFDWIGNDEDRQASFNETLSKLRAALK